MRLDRAVAILEQAGYRVNAFATTGPRTAGDLAAAAIESGCDLILAAGGDGTVNEVVNGIAGSNTAFGVLPAGTANVLANEIGLPGTPDQAARQLLEARPVRIALGSLERDGEPKQFFVLMAGVGLDARIVYELDLNLKSRLGKLAYWHGGFQQLGKPVPKFRISLNGAKYCASFALITRVRNYGGDFEIARKVRITDNDFEVVIFQNDEWQAYLRFFGAVMTDRLSRTEGVVIERAAAVHVSACEGPAPTRVYIQTDGEANGSVPAGVYTVPDALTLLIPERYIQRNGLA